MTMHEISRPFQRWVFVSYAHRDRQWMLRLLAHLKPLERSCGVQIFTDAQIDTGEDWHQQIEVRLSDANAAILLISADFLASKYITENEFPTLLARAKEDRGDLKVFPVFVGPCCYDEVMFEYTSSDKKKRERRLLSSIMGANDPATPLMCQTPCQQEETLSNVAHEIAKWFRELDHAPVGPKPTHPQTTQLVDVKRMPRSADFFKGRGDDLKKLDKWFEDDNVVLCTIVAQGGEGKSALVSQWLRQLERDGWNGARAFAWSFYSQGARELSGTADDFIFEALKFFGRKPPHEGSPEARGKLLADLISKEKAVLILDGLEPLQDHSGTIEDQAIAALITRLKEKSAENDSAKNILCVITTRQPVKILSEPGKVGDAARTGDVSAKQSSFGVESIKLEPLSPQDGASFLAMLGVPGSQRVLNHLSSEVNGHPLSLLLMGTYMRDCVDAPVAYEANSLLFNSSSMPYHVYLRIRAYDQYFQAQPHYDVLRMLGLFDRPATAGEIAVLRKTKIGNLTDNFAKIYDNDDEIAWKSILTRLRRAGLINEPTIENPGGVDAHPLVREYFANRLDQTARAKGHEALYKYLSECKTNSSDDHSPPPNRSAGSNDGSQCHKDLEIWDIMRLYQAIHHAVLAGCLEQALKEIYWPLIQRGQKGYSHRRFGLFQSELNMLRDCFKRPWMVLQDGLSAFWQAQILGITGSRLRALGKLEDAVKPLIASAEMHHAQGHALYAAIRARHLCELHMELGLLNEAVNYGKKAVNSAKGIDGSVTVTYRKEGVYAESGLSDPDEVRRDHKYQLVVAYSVLGAAQHQLGNFEEAKLSFAEAAEAAAKSPEWGSVSRLFGLWGFHYCRYLIDAIQIEPDGSKKNPILEELNVQVAAMHTASRDDILKFVPEGDLGLLGPNLVELIKTRAEFLPSDPASREAIFARAEVVAEDLRKGKRRDFIPLGLLNYVEMVREHLWYLQTSGGELPTNLCEKVDGELKTAEQIADHGKMKLFQVDCQIERGWFHRLNGDRTSALKCHADASKLAESLSYGRRRHYLLALKAAIDSV